MPVSTNRLLMRCSGASLLLMQSLQFTGDKTNNKLHLYACPQSRPCSNNPQHGCKL
uniref:Uncharacterized protein n=1 Tax=Setaria italica TaxID=4555 RepID=K3XU97_SETIT